MRSVKSWSFGRYLLAFALLAGAAPAANAAYAPPIGIPHPGFGVDDVVPVRPNAWNSSIAGYYYVNEQTGSDSGNPYGTPSNPRSTIPSSLPAGSYVEVHGTYSELTGGVIRIHGTGTNGAWAANQRGPVWIVGQDSNARPQFVGEKIVVTGSYVYFDHIVMNSGGRFQVSSGTTLPATDHIMLRNSEVVGLGDDGNGTLAAVNGSSTNPTSHVLFYGNVVHDSGNRSATTDVDAHLMNSGAYSSNVWLLENTLYNAAGAGVQINASADRRSTHHIYVGRNHVYNVRQSGIWLKAGSDVVFSENHVHDIINTSWSPSKGLGAQYEPERLWILYNTIHNVRFGVRIASTYNTATWDVYIIGNLIYDIAADNSITENSSWDDAGIHVHGGTNRYIVNNTIYNAPAGVNGSATAGTYYIVNNIISDVNHTNGNHLWIESLINNTTLSGNLFYEPAGSERIKWGGSTIHRVTSLQTATGKCSGCVAGDPRFVNAANDEFSIQADSLAKDSGDEATVYQTFRSLYGFGIAVDIQSKPRPVGGLWDMGAYEAGLGALVPSAPTNLRAD
jgi:hypothetical protein